MCLGNVTISTYVYQLIQTVRLQRVGSGMCSVTRQGVQSLARAWPSALQRADGCIKLPLPSCRVPVSMSWGHVARRVGAHVSRQPRRCLGTCQKWTPPRLPRDLRLSSIRVTSERNEAETHAGASWGPRWPLPSACLPGTGLPTKTVQVFLTIVVSEIHPRQASPHGILPGAVLCI